MCASRFVLAAASITGPRSLENCAGSPITSSAIAPFNIFNTRSAISSCRHNRRSRSEDHTSELQSLMRISYAVFCLKKKKKKTNTQTENQSPVTIKDYTNDSTSTHMTQNHN